LRKHDKNDRDTKMVQENNKLRELREARMLGKAELARKAGVSPLTIDRIEKGKPSRMDTKRKILQALGLKPADRREVFGDPRR
jgi:DNA-binding XRE family transcriptional regulator